MKTAPRDRLITIERTGAPTDDGYTTVPGAWATFTTEYAAVIYGSGREQREAAQLQASLPASFEVLANSKTLAVTELDRIVFDGAAWNIVAPPSRLGRDGVRIQAVRA